MKQGKYNCHSDWIVQFLQCVTVQELVKSMLNKCLENSSPFIEWSTNYLNNSSLTLFPYFCVWQSTDYMLYSFVVTRGQCHKIPVWLSFIRLQTKAKLQYTNKRRSENYSLEPLSLLILMISDVVAVLPVLAHFSTSERLIYTQRHPRWALCCWVFGGLHASGPT